MFIKMRKIISIITMSTLLFIIACQSDKESQTRLEKQPEPASPTHTNADSMIIELTGVDSLTVLELLKNDHRVNFRSSAMGVFITAIDSISNNRDTYWIYSVNDSIPSVACDKYLTHEGDRVKWHFRKISD